MPFDILQRKKKKNRRGPLNTRGGNSDAGVCRTMRSVGTAGPDEAPARATTGCPMCRCEREGDEIRELLVRREPKEEGAREQVVTGALHGGAPPAPGGLAHARWPATSARSATCRCPWVSRIIGLNGSPLQWEWRVKTSICSKVALLTGCSERPNPTLTNVYWEGPKYLFLG